MVRWNKKKGFLAANTQNGSWISSEIRILTDKKINKWLTLLEIL